MREEAEQRARTTSSIPVVSVEPRSEDSAPSTAPIPAASSLAAGFRVPEPLVPRDESAQSAPEIEHLLSAQSAVAIEYPLRAQSAPEIEHLLSEQSGPVSEHPLSELHPPTRSGASGAAGTAASERRAARGAELLEIHEEAQPVRHASPRRLPKRVAVVAGLAAGAALLLGSSAAVTAMVMPSMPSASGAGAGAAVTRTAEPPKVALLPVPEVEQSAPAADICAIPEFATALHSGDDEAAVIAAGGGEAFRSAVVEGRAPCVNLGDSSRVWAVVDKIRPASPIDYRPGALVLPDGVRNVEGGALRQDAASALTSLVNAARAAGAGEIALESGFRSYQTQEKTYGRHLAERGELADQVSARPGHSEHQLGLGADVVACAGACGTLDELGASPQGAWISEHAWEHGWIVRYVPGATPVTGYLPEPWHLRYIGPELAKSYHDGGWTSLEEFFALGPAPDYRD